MSRFAALVYLESNPYNNDNSLNEQSLIEKIGSVIESYNIELDTRDYDPSGFNYDYWIALGKDGGNWDTGYKKPILSSNVFRDQGLLNILNRRRLNKW
jgi:hypothetical protein